MWILHKVPVKETPPVDQGKYTLSEQGVRKKDRTVSFRATSSKDRTFYAGTPHQRVARGEEFCFHLSLGFGGVQVLKCFCWEEGSRRVERAAHMSANTLYPPSASGDVATEGAHSHTHQQTTFLRIPQNSPKMARKRYIFTEKHKPTLYEYE